MVIKRASVRLPRNRSLASQDIAQRSLKNCRVWLPDMTIGGQSCRLRFPMVHKSNFEKLLNFCNFFDSHEEVSRRKKICIIKYLNRTLDAPHQNCTNQQWQISSASNYRCKPSLQRPKRWTWSWFCQYGPMGQTSRKPTMQLKVVSFPLMQESRAIVVLRKWPDELHVTEYLLQGSMESRAQRHAWK